MCHGHFSKTICTEFTLTHACAVGRPVQEEVGKMRQRAARFQTEIKLPEYAPAEPPEDEQKKAQRAARFGTEYTPAAGLMEIGELVPV